MSLPQRDYLGPRCPHCAMPVWRGATRCPHCTGAINWDTDNPILNGLGCLAIVALVVYMFVAAIINLFK